MKKYAGFTLLEVLIVISIIGILAAFLLTNLSGSRERARDTNKKAELHNVAVALSLYQNSYGQFPATGNGLSFNACGTTGTTACPVCSTADFASGGTDGCSNVYMKNITMTNGNFFFRYYPCGSGTNYRLKVNLENKSDPEIESSQARCPGPICGLTYGTSDYVLCP